MAMRDNRSFRKHSGVIAYFHSTYVKSGRLPKEFGAVFQRVFDSRCEADYDDLVVLQKDELSEMLDQARRFVAKVKSLLQT
ncbi:MAG: HEPN domain-containing protein [Thermoguttaceae bacterium]